MAKKLDPGEVNNLKQALQEKRISARKRGNCPDCKRPQSLTRFRGKEVRFCRCGYFWT